MRFPVLIIGVTNYKELFADKILVEKTFIDRSVDDIRRELEILQATNFVYQDKRVLVVRFVKVSRLLQTVLLKFIEEFKYNLVIIFPSSEGILPTILSRVSLMRFDVGQTGFNYIKPSDLSLGNYFKLVEGWRKLYDYSKEICVKYLLKRG